MTWWTTSRSGASGTRTFRPWAFSNRARSLFPFSFTEMLDLKRKKPSLESLEEYLKQGGFPEYLKHGNDAMLQQVLKDINRDVVVRYGLRNSKLIEQLATYLLANAGKEFSHNNLRKMFGVGSTNSITSYVSFFEDSYLIFTIPRFDYSYRKQLVNPKKSICYRHWACPGVSGDGPRCRAGRPAPRRSRGRRGRRRRPGR